jgi:hypothetical protein
MLRPKVIEVRPSDNYELFKTVHTNGFTVEWEQEIDLCPDELYYESVSIK